MSKLALVAGASRGIGNASSEALAGASFRVIRIARSVDPGDSDCVRCDLTDAGDVDSAIRSIESVGVPDLMVLSTGSFKLGALEETTVEEMRQQFESNVLGPFSLLRAFVPAMARRGGGRIITIGSIADHLPLPGNSAYAAAKYGLRGLHGVLREEYSGSGIGFTLISPGPTDTSLWDEVDPDSRDDLPSRASMMRARDVAEAVLWVATRPPSVDIELLRMGPG